MYREKISLITDLKFIFIFCCIILFVSSESLLFLSNDSNSIFKSSTNEYRKTDHLEEISSNLKNSNLNFSDFSDNVSRKIYFDMSHEQIFSIWDTGFMGYSELNILLQDYFLEVSTISHSFCEKVSNLTSNDILFLNVAKNGSYTQSELSKISAFVDRGGKVIILGEHEGFNFIEFQNPLLERFGMEILPESIDDDQNYIYDKKGWVSFDSPYFNLKNLSILLGSRINIKSENAFPIAVTSDHANYPNAPIMAGYEHPNNNGGKVFCCSDTEWLWNGDNQSIGLFYGNNSQLVFKILDWFYDLELSNLINQGLSIKSEYDFFTSRKDHIFKLNLTISKPINITINSIGALINSKHFINVEGNHTFLVNTTQNGYINFLFNNSQINGNFSKKVCFMVKNTDIQQRILFFGKNFARKLNAGPSGLLEFGLSLWKRNYSIFYSSSIKNFSDYKWIIISNPLEILNANLVSEFNENQKKSKFIFLNNPYSSLNLNISKISGRNDIMVKVLRDLNFTALDVPINDISRSFGINFSRYLLVDPIFNQNDEIYTPKIRGENATFYNISTTMVNIINVSRDFHKELFGYSTAWGDPITTFGFENSIGNPDYGINNTCVLAYKNDTLASGMLNLFTNEYFDDSQFFIKFLFKWMSNTTNEFSKKFSAISNKTEFYYKNQSFLIETNSKLKDQKGKIVPDGTLFNVEFSKGQVISKDASPNVPGFQIKSEDGEFNLSFNCAESYGFFEIAIYNLTKYNIIISLSSTYLNFSTRPFLNEIASNPSPNGNITLEWKEHPGAKTYYIYRNDSPISNINKGLFLTNTSQLQYNDSLIFGKYYYAIVASNYTFNSTFSNSVSIEIHPILQLKSRDPNHNGSIEIFWDSLVGAKTYYIFKDTKEISQAAIETCTAIPLDNVSSCSYIDSKNNMQGVTYYYAIIGGNYEKNSSISNLVSVQIQYIPSIPELFYTYIKKKETEFTIEWKEVSYSLNYAVYLSKFKNFEPNRANLYSITETNSLELKNLPENKYYVKIKALGQYGNSSISEFITIEVILQIPVPKDNTNFLLNVVIIGIFLLTIINFAYIYYYTRFKKKNIQKHPSKSTIKEDEKILK